MVAYSFQRMFVDPILSKRKRHTVRGIGLRTHAREGSALQLYTAMRTKQCRLIGRAVALAPLPIKLTFGRSAGVTIGKLAPLQIDREEFAELDGFMSWAKLVDFWEIHHADSLAVGWFDGLLIPWGESFEAAP